ncbi:DUF664 domain-containing protein [Georgenia sp. 10Sc9-8]|uniref:DUF664 domain-containing protein n=1 Tax=Georgenia halotolerans TaxID=3028317 RepID=A0ABT5TZS2_9MICO|nr:DUF664 domain-containing protein [Georgenia halotolerans]
MDITALLEETYSRVPDEVAAVLDGLDPAALTTRPDPQANTIAWLVWHLARGQDAQIAQVAGTEEVWTAQGWADRFDLPLERTDTGFGHTSDQVAAVQADAQLLQGYLGDVHRATREYLKNLTGDDLDQVVDDSWDPPVTLGVRLVSIVADDLQHAGQAAYVRGLVERTR